MVRAKTVESQFNVHVMRIGGRWYAFRGGNGTGEPVVDIAQALRIDTLQKRVAAALAGERKDSTL